MNKAFTKQPFQPNVKMVYLSTDTNTMHHGFSRLKYLKILDSSSESMIPCIFKIREMGKFPLFYSFLCHYFNIFACKLNKLGYNGKSKSNKSSTC